MKGFQLAQPQQPSAADPWAQAGWAEVLRWVAAGMGETARQFRWVNGYLRLTALRAALDATVAAVTSTKEDAAA